MAPLSEHEIAAGAAFLAAIILADLAQWPTQSDLPVEPGASGPQTMPAAEGGMSSVNAVNNVEDLRADRA